MANGLFNLKQVVQAVQQGGWPAQKPPSVEYLVVAGGGGGGGYAPGGGGGLLQGLDSVPNGQTLLVTVGAGGTNSPTNGGNSVFGSVTSIGGGRPAFPPVSGGSGGGGPNGPTTNAIGLPGQGTAGQGNTGGFGRDTGASYYGGGGGGAGTTGYAANNGVCGTGGAGIASVISGTVTAYAGGGGGGHAYGGNPGAGGVGGGGAGGDAVNPTPANGYPGVANTGGGGGAASYNGAGANAAAGGSGIVIVSYPDVYAAATTVNATASTSGSGSIYNAGAGTVQFTGTATPFTFSGDFTIEGWYNLANFNNAAGGGNPTLISCGGTPNWLVGIPGGTYVFYSGGNLVLQTSAVASANTWNHFAVVRSGTTVTIYHNGASVGTATLGTTVTGASTTTVTSNGTGGVGSVTGYMSNVRVVKGTAVYTGAFTPSTIPLTAITDTQLLMNAVSGGYLVDGSTNSFTPTTSSTSLAWNQLSPFTATGYKNRVYTWTTSGTITF